MSVFRNIVLAALMTSGTVMGAQAADLITVPVASSPVSMPVADAGFNWSGFYAGVYGVAQDSPAWDTQLGAGLALGVNAQFDFMLVGAEVALHGLTAGAIDTTYGQVLGKAGVIVTDNVLLYAAAGYGIDLGAPAEDDLLAGGGVEFAVADNVSLRAQYLHGFPLSGGNPKDQVSLGANFHF